MKLLAQTVIGLALVGAALWNSGPATHAQVIAIIRLQLICEGPPGVRGTATGDIGGTPFELSCSSDTGRVERIVSTGTGEQKVLVARGALSVGEATCPFMDGLPTQARCSAIGDPNVSVMLVVTRSGGPEFKY